MDFWKDAPRVLAGRDITGGGAWMGVTPSGRFAAVTNYRDPRRINPGALSRGGLVSDYLLTETLPEKYAERIRSSMERFNGFNLIVGDPRQIVYTGNRTSEVRVLRPGIYGLSNHLLDTPWFKVERGKQALRKQIGANEHIAPAMLFSILQDRTPAPEDRLPDTGVGREWELVLSPIFISTPDYGTRCSTVLLMDREGRTTVVERAFRGPSKSGPPFEERAFTFFIDSPRETKGISNGHNGPV